MLSNPTVFGVHVLYRPNVLATPHYVMIPLIPRRDGCHVVLSVCERIMLQDTWNVHPYVKPITYPQASDPGISQ